MLQLQSNRMVNLPLSFRLLTVTTKIQFTNSNHNAAPPVWESSVTWMAWCSNYLQSAVVMPSYVMIHSLPAHSPITLALDTACATCTERCQPHASATDYYAIASKNTADMFVNKVDNNKTCCITLHQCHYGINAQAKRTMALNEIWDTHYSGHKSTIGSQLSSV